MKLFLLILAGMCHLLPATAAGVNVREDFESNAGGFTTSSLNSWKWGATTSPEGPGQAHSGTQVWGTNLTGSYAADLNADLLSPMYDLSAAAGQHVILHWWQFLVTEEIYDYAEVQVSKDGGGTWQTVAGPRDGAVSAEWQQQTVLLDPSYATAQFQIRFILVTDHSTAEGGFFIDDIRIATAEFEPATAVQDFETDDGGYVADGVNSSWEYGTPVSAPGGAFSGAAAWATNLNGFYNADEDSTLTSPALDLSSAAGKLLALSWQQFFETEENYDLVTVEISADGGTEWTPASTSSGALSTDGWMPQHVIIPSSFATSTFRLRFRLQSDEAYQYAGVALDDISILATDRLFPIAGSFSKSAPENYPIQFTRAGFAAAYTDPDGGFLTEITVVQLPAAGVLKLAGEPVVLNTVIPADGLDSLTYEPVADSTGTWSFQYTARNFFADSEVATVTLNILGPLPQIVIAEDPQPVTVNPGSPVTLTVIAVSSLELDYQWRKGGQDIPNAREASYTLPSVTEDDENTYDVVITNTADSKPSGTAFVSVNDPVTITGQTGDTSANEGGEITLSVTATGTGRLDYQWYKDEEVMQDETFPELHLEDLEDSDSAIYHCVVTNIVGPEPSAPIDLTVRLAPRITSNPVSIGIQKLRPATFEVTVEGAGPFTYQWYKNGSAVPGATAAILVIDDLTEETMGQYTVRVSNGWATAESEPAELQVLSWLDVRGIYQDVLERPDAPVDASPYPARLTVTLTGLGSATAVLTYDGSTHRFAGKLDSQLVIERSISRGKRVPLAVRIQLDTLDHTIDASLSLTDATGLVQSSGLLPKHVYVKKINPAPQEGRYTVLLEPEEGIVGAPSAPGYLTAQVKPDGKVTLAGKLPNGAVLTSSGFIHDTGRLPFHRMLGKLFGDVCGRLSIDLNHEVPLVQGELAWRHLPKVNSPLLPEPFIAVLEAEGSLFVRPAAGLPVLTLPSGAELYALSIQGPLAGGDISRWLRLTPPNKAVIDPVTEAKIKMTLNRTTGKVTGSFVDTGTGKRLLLEGVVNQGSQSMGGFFRTLEAAGDFRVIPWLE
ncbi:immunoglobulin domain-containing protein [Prosthecobacter sp. SYSU 5D2]|uniref:immunoglobulin domain-containing protein n=1 Tax=Prosthecobacter sp. SYSU 5D2 TaxID=3134134 RepID=UPI0031FEBCCF